MAFGQPWLSTNGRWVKQKLSKPWYCPGVTFFSRRYWIPKKYIGNLWTPKPWKMKVLGPQYMGYNPYKWRLWVPMEVSWSENLRTNQFVSLNRSFFFLWISVRNRCLLRIFAKIFWYSDKKRPEFELIGIWTFWNHQTFLGRHRCNARSALAVSFFSTFCKTISRIAARSSKTPGRRKTSWGS